jgi:hypothetical protein
MALNQNFSDFFEQPAPKPAQPKPAQPKPAAPAEDKFAGVPAWTDIQSKPEFQALPAAKQAEAKAAYFDYWVAPRVGQDAGAIREQFLGPAPEPAPAVDEQAGQAAFGIYPKAKSAKPAKPILEQPGPVPDQEFTSRAPVKPEVRRAFEAAWNSATPAERSMMGAAPGWTGQLARERAGFAQATDQGMAQAGTGMRTMLEGLDPRAEFRAARLRLQGEDPRFAETAGREGAKRNVTPGQEIKALDGTVQESTFNFETADFFDPKNPANGANNALVRGITKGVLGIGKTYAGLFQFQSDLIGFDAASKSAADAGRGIRGQEEAIGERGTFLERNLEGAVSSIAQQLPLLITGTAVASQAIPLAGMALQSFGQEYSDGRAKGQNTGQAATRAGMFSAFEVIGEKFGLGAQMDALRAAARGMPTDEIANLLFSALKKEIPGELLTTTGQFSVDKFAGNGIGLNPNATFGDYMKQVADTIAQTIMQSGLMGAGTTGVSAGVRFLRDSGVSQGVAEADAEAAKRTALDRWSGFIGRKQPAADTPTTVDGRIEPSLGATAPAGDPLVQTADEIVRGMATDAGLPESTVLPTAPTATNAPAAEAQPTVDAGIAAQTSAGAPATPAAITQGDQDILDFAGTRFQQLRDKQGTPEEPGPGLSASESQELQALVQARGNPVALREFYGIDQPGEADVRQTEESLDGSASGPATGQGAQGQAAPGAVPEQPGQQPNEDGQAQGLDQAIDGLGALFGGQQQETEAQREARLEREAIQGESAFQAQAPTNDDDIPLDLGPPRTEKEARQRKEQQPNVQADQAQQAETPREETLRAPAAPQGAAAPGVGPKTEREAKRQRDVEDLTAQVNSATSLEELSRIANESNARFPEADVLGEGEPNDDDRAMAAVSRAAAQRAKQIMESGRGNSTTPKTEKEAKERKQQPATEAELDALYDRAEKLTKDFPKESGEIQQQVMDAGEKFSLPEVEARLSDLEQRQERVRQIKNDFNSWREGLRRTEGELRTSLLDPANKNRTDEINKQIENLGDQAAAGYQKLEADIEAAKTGKPAKPKTEREAKQQRLADKPLPEWTQKKDNSFPDGTSFEWEQNGDNVFLVAKVGDKVVSRQSEGQVRERVAYGSMVMSKALLEEKMRELGLTPDQKWTPKGGDTSVQDAIDRREKRSDERSRVSGALDDAIKRADKAGATETKSKLVGARIKFDNKSMGPAEVRKLIERTDSDIEKETAPKTGAEPQRLSAKQINRLITKHGTQFNNPVEIERAFGDGDLVFASHDMMEEPAQVTTMKMLESYTPDQLFIVPRAAAEETLSRGGAPKPKTEKEAKAPAPPPPPPPPPPQAPTLSGVKVKFDVMVEDTGQTASMTVDAAAQMKEYEDRESVLRELIACLQK